MADPIFVDGLMFKKPHENAPDFIKGKVSMKVEDLIKFLIVHGRDKKKEWLNADFKKSKKGSYYYQLDTWKAGDASTKDLGSFADNLREKQGEINKPTGTPTSIGEASVPTASKIDYPESDSKDIPF